jgi:hypothetical protein
MADKPSNTKSGFSRWLRNRLISLLMIAAFSLIFVHASLGGTYTCTELVPPAGWGSIAPSSINNSGVVVGTGSLNGLARGFIYSDVGWAPLLPQGWEVEAFQPPLINNNGMVVGLGFAGGAMTGFVYQGGIVSDLVAADGGYLFPTCINDNNVVAGMGNRGGFVYDGKTVSELPAPDLFPISINDKNVVVGTGNNGGFMYDGKTVTGLQAGGWASLSPKFINSSGVVVGYGNHGGIWKGFIYDGRKSPPEITPLLPPGWSSAYATSINENGVVVGYGNHGGVMKGFIYDGAQYVELLPQGWTSAQAQSINDSGAVVGSGYAPGAAGAASFTRGFIATPRAPEEEIADILDFIDAALTAGTLGGNQLNGAEKALTKAASAIDQGNIKKTCNKLDTAYARNHKQLKSKKAGVAETAAEVEQQIQDVMDGLGCK